MIKILILNSDLNLDISLDSFFIIVNSSRFVFRESDFFWPDVFLSIVTREKAL